jgi:hypothetical protein
MSDDVEAAYARVREASARVDPAWEGRITAPDELSQALEELSAAGLARTEALGGSAEEISG